MFKTVIDKIVPDAIKIILQRCEQDCRVAYDDELFKKIMKQSKYQWTELSKQKKIEQWDEIMLEIEASPEQIE